MKIKLRNATLFNKELSSLPNSKLLINTINAYSYNLAQEDEKFSMALSASDILLPDGISIVWAIKLLNKLKIRKIAGADLFLYEMNRLQQIKGKCFFLGSSESTLKKIKERATLEYPEITIETFSPPFKPSFTEEDNQIMLNHINAFNPDVLFVGMTAPKQEKWAYSNFNNINAKHVCCIGAVFDFYAGTVRRAPQWMIHLSLEWFYRLVKEPKRMWRRYLIGNIKFIIHIINE